MSDRCSEAEEEAEFDSNYCPECDEVADWVYDQDELEYECQACGATVTTEWMSAADG